jgi:hypothetical protein
MPDESWEFELHSMQFVAPGIFLAFSDEFPDRQFLIMEDRDA